MSEISKLQEEVLKEIEKAESLTVLEDIRVTTFGKKGRLTHFMKQLGELSHEQKKEMGQALNLIKQELVDSLEARKRDLEIKELNVKLVDEKIDVTLPSVPENIGGLHPITQTIEEVVSIFNSMGFTVAEGPDIENDFHNFTALNIPEEHPARQEHDTFYLPNNAKGENMVLRTHTSTVQIRTMMEKEPPLRILSVGRVYRSDYDITHTPMFHQFEGLVVEEKIHMGHLKSCLLEFLKAYFDLEDLPLRFRPSFFPFTEPSAEVDIGYERKGGELKIGSGSDWLEILGCGMVHPNVLKNCGLDPEKYQGFAFGMGVERIAMLKYGIPDLRSFFDGDERWLGHYNFNFLDIPSLLKGAA